MNYLAKIRENWLSILLVTIVAVSISIILTFIQTFEYRSTFSLLVIEKDPNLDAYAAAKSAERLSTSLGQVIYTTSFFDKVMSSGYLSKDIIFPEDEQERREQWKRQIETRVLPDVGLVKISVYNKNREQATQLANVLAMVLTENGTEYLGGGNTITLKIVDYPLTTKGTARPNIPLNIVAGLVLGFIGSASFHIIRSIKVKNYKVDSAGPDTIAETNIKRDENSELKRIKDNDYIIEEYHPKRQMIEEVEDIPRSRDYKKNKRDYRNEIRTFHDHSKGIQESNYTHNKWNEPEEEFRNFE